MANLQQPITEDTKVSVTVRLPRPLDRALERHCTDRDITKTQAVEEAITAYLPPAA